MHFARPENQLARQPRIRELYRGHGPRQRIPVSHRHTTTVPRRPRPDQIEPRVIHRATHCIEVREQQIAIYDAVERRIARRLLERPQSLDRRRE